NGLTTFEVYSEVDSAAVVHGQGTVVRLAEHEMAGAPRLDLPALQAQCNQGVLSGTQCYHAFRAMHMTYGPGHQGIDALYLGAQDGAGQVLARLTLPEHLRADLDRYTLHPCLLDSALQAALGLSGFEGKEVDHAASAAPALPFAVERMDVL